MTNKAQPELKVAIVVDREIPLGHCVNTAAVLALSLGRAVDGIIGPIPILTATVDGLRAHRGSFETPPTWSRR